MAPEHQHIFVMLTHCMEVAAVSSKGSLRDTCTNLCLQCVIEIPSPQLLFCRLQPIGSNFLAGSRHAVATQKPMLSVAGNRLHSGDLELVFGLSTPPRFVAKKDPTAPDLWMAAKWVKMRDEQFFTRVSSKASLGFHTRSFVPGNFMFCRCSLHGSSLNEYLHLLASTNRA